MNGIHVPPSYAVQIDRMYHVENPRPFISSPLTLYGRVTGFFTANLQDLSKIHVNFHEISSNMTM